MLKKFFGSPRPPGICSSGAMPDWATLYFALLLRLQRYPQTGIYRAQSRLWRAADLDLPYCSLLDLPRNYPMPLVSFLRELYQAITGVHRLPKL